MAATVRQPTFAGHLSSSTYGSVNRRNVTLDGNRSRIVEIMNRHEAVVAWRLFELTWILLAAVCAVFALSLALTDFTIDPLGVWALCGVVALYAGFAYYNAK